jgi:hypothetical protein
MWGENCTKYPCYCQLRASCIEGKCSCLESVAENKANCPLKPGITGLASTPCQCSETDTTKCDECLKGATCTLSTPRVCVCIDQYAIAGDLSCKPDIGSACSATYGSPDDHCANCATCNEGRCTAEPGQPCSSSLDCMSGSVCQDFLCKLDLDKKCSGNRTLPCLIGSVCDAVTQKCKIPPISTHSSCKGSNRESCASGAVCDETDGLCYCDPELSIYKKRRMSS